MAEASAEPPRPFGSPMKRARRSRRRSDERRGRRTPDPRLIDEGDALAQKALLRARSARVRGITLQNLGTRRVRTPRLRGVGPSTSGSRSRLFVRRITRSASPSRLPTREGGAGSRGPTSGSDDRRRGDRADAATQPARRPTHCRPESGGGECRHRPARRRESLLTEALGHFTSARTRFVRRNAWRSWRDERSARQRRRNGTAVLHPRARTGARRRRSPAR
jgi:hypothetical protein